MSASAAQIQRRRAKNAAAIKARKTKIRAIALVSIFAIVLVIQGPKTVKMITGGDEATSAAAPASASASSAAREPKASRELQKLRSNPGGDPFLIRAIVDRDSRAGVVAGPAGTRDPFATRSTAAEAGSTAAPPVAQPVAQTKAPLVLGTPTRSRVARRSFIAVLASVPTSSGRSTATRFARSASASGVGSIGVVNSSKRNPLRPGYYVVYLGPFSTLRGATAAVARAHRYGYRGAYRRELVRY